MSTGAFQQIDYNKYNAWGVGLWEKVLISKGYDNIDTIEDYGVDIKAYKNNKKTLYEIGVLDKCVWTSKEDFPYRQPNFLVRKNEGNYKDLDFWYIQICYKTQAIFYQRSGIIYEEGKLGERWVTRQDGTQGWEWFYFLDKDRVKWWNIPKSL